MPLTSVRQNQSKSTGPQTSISTGYTIAQPTTYMGTLKKVCVGLWIAQAMLVAFLLFAGGIQLVLPVAEMARPSHGSALPILIGIAQSLSAMGWTLPGLLQTSIGMAPLLTFGMAVVLVSSPEQDLTTSDSIDCRHAPLD